MAIPFTKYLDIKDNYCLGYFGDDKETLNNFLQARECIEKELKGIKIFISCKDSLKGVVHGKRNIILESKMDDYKGKIAYFCNLEEKGALKLLLIESKIPIPVDF